MQREEYMYALGVTKTKNCIFFKYRIVFLITGNAGHFSLYISKA